MTKKELYARFETEAARLCAGFLKPVLSVIAPSDWWETRVIAKLSDDQKNNVGGSFESLDLAGLLMVFNSNWIEIAEELKKSHKKITKEDRNIVNAMITYRKHSAHFSVEGLPADDIHRDFDTLWRFMELVGAGAKTIQEIKDINKEGYACGYDENKLEHIINPPKKEPENRKTKAKKVKETVFGKPENTNTGEKKSQDKVTYIISSGGIELFTCTYEETKKKIFDGEIRRDLNIYEAGSTIAAPGPEIGSIPAFKHFFDDLAREQEELRQKEIVEEKKEQQKLKEKTDKADSSFGFLFFGVVVGVIVLLILTGWWIWVLIGVIILFIAFLIHNC
ncbi:MAG: hypothetical protein LBH43_08210 [Treponema sp.]|jgi:hypothetical protein|nr:hypothetical protein [Treponema sp.]